MSCSQVVGFKYSHLLITSLNLMLTHQMLWRGLRIRLFHSEEASLKKLRAIQISKSSIMKPSPKSSSSFDEISALSSMKEICHSFQKKPKHIPSEETLKSKYPKPVGSEQIDVKHDPHASFTCNYERPSHSCQRCA
ncbi:hypothetical protein Vadar_003328 [Vaccinium darrowii]|uniref:Uncharacterized protein n=1 Tax=Vaccinium darrowii TaxID=229202 RepID=A0ACB7XFL6_9ERIC|nr:hypothetical protein Vadar_003328 [Vaccinium darrowii]